MTQALKDRVALVTGASSGIGEATALMLANAGARVAVAARRRDRLEDVAKRIRAAGSEALVVEADFGVEAKRSVPCTKPRRRSDASTSSSTTPA